MDDPESLIHYLLILVVGQKINSEIILTFQIAESLISGQNSMHQWCPLNRDSIVSLIIVLRRVKIIIV